MNLTTNFSLEELTHSEVAERKGIDNRPNEAIIENLRKLANGLELVRALLGGPILVSSGFRCPALNQLIGGAARSQHMEGLAADFICPAAGVPAEICRKIAASAIPFDQLIYEYTWCHISFADSPRYSILTFNRVSKGYDRGIIG